MANKRRACYNGPTSDINVAQPAVKDAASKPRIIIHVPACPMRAPTPAIHSPDSRRALLRRTWQPPFDSLEVDYSRPALDVRLLAGDRTLIAGLWTFTTTVDRQPLSVTGSWEEVCWHSDREVDYLELEIPLSSGWKVQRQMVLGRKDQFLLLADAVLGEEALASGTRVEVRHTFELPLADGISFSAEEETREGFLLGKRKRVARVFPLPLPEWRAEHSSGELQCDDRGLTICHAGLGRNLYVPLWLDLSPSRHRRQCTWRRLTIGESLQVQPRDVATGYRVQAGKEQWLVYRSLAPPRSRTVLGQNFATDFVLSRFLASGEAEEILAVE